MLLYPSNWHVRQAETLGSSDKIYVAPVGQIRITDGLLIDKPGNPQVSVPLTEDTWFTSDTGSAHFKPLWAIAVPPKTSAFGGMCLRKNHKKIHFISGIAQGDSSTHDDLHYEFNLETNQWTELAAFPGTNGRRDFACAWVDENVMVLAGGVSRIGSVDSYTASTYIYERDIDTWTVTNPILAGARKQMKGFSTVADRFRIIGGTNSASLATGAQDDQLVFVPSTESWLAQSNFPYNICRYSLGWDQENDQYYLYGGQKTGVNLVNWRNNEIRAVNDNGSVTFIVNGNYRMGALTMVKNDLLYSMGGQSSEDGVVITEGIAWNLVGGLNVDIVSNPIVMSDTGQAACSLDGILYYNVAGHIWAYASIGAVRPF